MTRTSKYLGKIYEGWTVTHIGVATVTAKRHKGKGLNNRPGHQAYYYVLSRVTSDGACDKQVRVNAQQMANIARGTFSVEAYSDQLNEKNLKNKTLYSFN